MAEGRLTPRGSCVQADVSRIYIIKLEKGELPRVEIIGTLVAVLEVEFALEAARKEREGPRSTIS